MTWARLDDRTGHSPEWVAIDDVALQRAAEEMPDARPHEIADRADQLAQLAKLVHYAALMWSVPALSDGRISPSGAQQVCTLASIRNVERFYVAADILVDAGAWKRINRSKKEPLGAYQMLLGWSPGEQPTRKEDEDRRARNRLRDALRVGAKDYPNRVAAIKRAEGRCEYCDAELGDGTGQIDHVDPTLMSNDLDNLAWACGSCNKRKGLHQLDDVDMAFTQRARALRHTWSTRGHMLDPSVDTVTDRVGVGRGSGRARVGRGSGKGSGSGRARAAKRQSKTTEPEDGSGTVSDVA